jgi:plasmid maintenance system antidote protein VapI
VVSTYLSGVDGFISEPYTSEQLQELVQKVLDPARERVVHSAVRAVKSVTLLAREAVGHIDKMWMFRLEGGKGSGSALGELKRIEPSLRQLQEKHADAFEVGMCSVFEAVLPPDPSLLKSKSSSRAKRAQHPGQIIRSLMEQRGLTNERLLSLVRISPEEFEQILSGDLVINDVIARELSRALGKTAREWIALQRAFDVTKPKGEN